MASPIRTHGAGVGSASEVSVLPVGASLFSVGGPVGRQVSAALAYRTPEGNPHWARNTETLHFRARLFTFFCYCWEHAYGLRYTSVGFSGIGFDLPIIIVYHLEWYPVHWWVIDHKHPIRFAHLYVLYGVRRGLGQHVLYLLEKP